MLMHFSEAGFSWYWIAIAIFWIVKAVIGSKKKKSQSSPSGKTTPSQPGKTIEDILKELEERTIGKIPTTSYAEPTPTSIPEPLEEIEPKVVYQRTVADYKKEKHSDMAKHHVTKEKLSDGKFDDIDDKLMHLEAFELNAHAPIEQAALSIDDMRRAVVLDAVLNRPEW